MVILTQYLCYILTQHWVTEITQIGVHLTPNYLECIQSFSAYFGLGILLSLLPYLVYYPTPFYFALVTWDMGLKLNIFINVISSLSPCISRFRNDFWKWRRSHYGSFSMLLWQAKMLILPGRRPYTRSSASWTVRSQRFLNLPTVCRSFCMSKNWYCLVLNNFTLPQRFIHFCMKIKVAFLNF